MLVYGAGGHAEVVLSCLAANGIPPSGIFDDDRGKTRIGDMPVYGPYDPCYMPERTLVLAIGDNELRRRLVPVVRHAFGRVIHPSALVDASVLVGSGSVIFHGVIVQVSSVIGQHVIVNTRATVDHGCVIGDFVHLAPGVILCGNVEIGAGTLVGAGTIVTPNVYIGRDCLIGAGSIVSRDIPDGTRVPKGYRSYGMSGWDPNDE